MYLFLRHGHFSTQALILSYSIQRQGETSEADRWELKSERRLGTDTMRPGRVYLPFRADRRSVSLPALTIVTLADIQIVEQYALSTASYLTIRLMQIFRTIKSRDDNPFAGQVVFADSDRKPPFCHIQIAIEWWRLSRSLWCVCGPW